MMDVDELRRHLDRVAAEDEIDTTRAWLAIDTRASRLRRHRRIGSALVAVGLIGLLTLGLVALRNSPGDHVNTISPATTGAAPAPTTTTIGSGVSGMPFDFQGYVPGESVVVNQCVAAALPTVCGLETIETHADASGTVRGTFSPVQWIFTSDGWIDCLTQTCMVKVAANSDRLVNAGSVDLSGVSPVPQPNIALTIDTPGPYMSDQEVTIRITGAPPGMQGAVSVCTKVPADSVSSAMCGAGGDTTFTTGPDGTATLQRFRLPALPCTAPASCQVAWDPGYDYPSLASQDIDYT
jgi:hypothetical protein